MSTLVEVLERGSYTAAARRLGISKSIASRRIARLEATLNVRLIERTTRGLAPTEAGRAFHERCRGLLRALEEACEQVASTDTDVAGVLRVTAPASFSRTLLMPVVAALTRAHPRLTVQVDLDERRLDLLAESFDLAVRAGDLPDSGFVQRRLCRLDGVVAASPAYLEQRGEPLRPTDLSMHVGLDHAEMQPGGLWRFVEPPGDGAAVVFERRHLVNSFDALLDLAVAGVGVAALPVATATAALEAGQLRVLMPGWTLTPHELAVLFPASRKGLPKVRAMLDALLRHAGLPQPQWGRAEATGP